MSRFGAFTTVLAITVPGVLAASPAQAVGPVQLGRAQYDSPGSPDTGSNKSLNGEYVEVRNTGPSAVSLRGWTLTDSSRRTPYAFGNYVLAAGSSVRVHSGAGANTQTDRFWNNGDYIWNNTGGDTANLRNARHVLVDSCQWFERGKGYIFC